MLPNWIKLLLRSRYESYLETEVLRLREDNRELVSNVLVQAGFAPLPSKRTPQPQAPVRGHQVPSQWKRAQEAKDARPKKESDATQN